MQKKVTILKILAKLKGIRKIFKPSLKRKPISIEQKISSK